MELIALILALAGLWAGTEWTLRGAVAIAARLGISEFVVGIAVLSVGSDLPELSIAISAALQTLGAGPDASNIVVGTALGSSLGQIGFVLGAVGLAGHLALPPPLVLRHGIVLLGSLAALAAAGIDGVVTRAEGVALVGLYAMYIAWLLRGAAEPEDAQADDGQRGGYRAWLLLAGGLALVTFAAELTVDSALGVAAWLGVSETVVAVVIIGLGSSLPELSISLAAAVRGKSGLSVGNLIGSNIFDTLVPVGVAAAIVPLGFDAELYDFEVPFLAIVSVAALGFLLTRGRLHPVEAAVLLALYGGYLLARLDYLPALSS